MSKTAKTAKTPPAPAAKGIKAYNQAIKELGHALRESHKANRAYRDACDKYNVKIEVALDRANDVICLTNEALNHANAKGATSKEKARANDMTCDAAKVINDATKDIRRAVQTLKRRIEAATRKGMAV